MREQPTARTVVDGDIPGGLNVFLQDQITVTGPDASTTVDITENEIVGVGVGDEITVAANIENNASTGSGNVDSCSQGSGTSLRLVLGGLAVDGTVQGPVQCIEDSGFFSGPNVETAYVTFTVPDSVGNSQFELWVEGTNSEVRLTPIYGITLDVSGETVEPPEEPPSDDPDDGDDGGDPPEEFGLGDVTAECSIESTAADTGETVDVDVELSGTSPDTNSYEVFVELLVDGEIVAQDSGFVTPNGASGASFEVEFDEPGQYDIDYQMLSYQQT